MHGRYSWFVLFLFRLDGRLDYVTLIINSLLVLLAPQPGGYYSYTNTTTLPQQVVSSFAVIWHEAYTNNTTLVLPQQVVFPSQRFFFDFNKV